MVLNAKIFFSLLLEYFKYTDYKSEKYGNVDFLA